MRRRAAQEPVEIDVLQKKKEELAKFVDRYNDAVSMVTGTVNLFISYVINKFRYKTTILYTKLR